MKRYTKLLLAVLAICSLSNIQAGGNPFENLEGEAKINALMGVSWLAFVGGGFRAKKFKTEKDFLSNHFNNLSVIEENILKEKIATANGNIIFFTIIAALGGISFGTGAFAKVQNYYNNR